MREGSDYAYARVRTLRVQVSSIGVWETVYLCILHIAIPTNVGLVLFTTRLLELWTVEEKVWAFVIGCAAGLASVQLILRAAPPMSEAVKVQLQRQQLYTSRVIDGVSMVFHDEAEAEEDAEAAKVLCSTGHVDAFVNDPKAKKAEAKSREYARKMANAEAEAAQAKKERKKAKRAKRKAKQNTRRDSEEGSGGEVDDDPGDGGEDGGGEGGGDDEEKEDDPSGLD